MGEEALAASPYHFLRMVCSPKWPGATHRSLAWGGGAMARGVSPRPACGSGLWKLFIYVPVSRPPRFTSFPVSRPVPVSRPPLTPRLRLYSSLSHFPAIIVSIRPTPRESTVYS